MTKTIVMIHGAFCGGWSFANLKDQFTQWGYVCLCPDLRHHEPHSRWSVPDELGTTGLDDFVQDLEALIRGLTEPPILMGHSMGGLLCQKLAAKGLCQAAVLLAPSAPWGVLPTTHFEIASAYGLFQIAGNYWEQPVRPAFHLAAEHALNRLSPQDQHETFARFVPESGRAIFEVLHWAADPTRASQVFARDVKCPILAIAGGQDRINPPQTVRHIAGRYRQFGTYLEVPQMGHWLIGEAGWQEVAAAAHHWLSADQKLAAE